MLSVSQIPAFLVAKQLWWWAAAKTGKVVNLQKGQFMSPEVLQTRVTKVTDSWKTNK